MSFNSVDLRSELLLRLSALTQGPLGTSSRDLFETLGYRSQRTLAIHSVSELQQLFDPNGYLSEQNAFLSRWRSVEFLFQLTNSELAGNDRQGLLLAEQDRFDLKEVKSYVFFAVDLAINSTGDLPTRTELSNITRALNRLVPMPVLVLFRHGLSASIAIINRYERRKK